MSIGTKEPERMYQTVNNFHKELEKIGKNIFIINLRGHHMNG